MDNKQPLAIQEKKSYKPKHRQNPQKPKKKQQEKTSAPATTTSSGGVKVVYISSPVNFNTSASEFRSLVQQLTGRDNSSSENSNDADHLSGIVGGRQHQESVVNVESTRAYNNDNDEKQPEIAVQHQESAEKCDQNSNLLDAYDQPNNVNYNMPDQMLDNFSPSNY